jgi:hypothetical protein
MEGRFVARGGWDIEAIALNGHACYRVSRHGFLVGNGYYSPAALEELLEKYGLGLADLMEDDPDGGISPGVEMILVGR